MTKTKSQIDEKRDEFERLLEESFVKAHSVADIVEGSVIRKEKDGWLVSVKGTKTEAYLPDREVSDTVEAGDLKEFYVLREENDEEQMLLSLKRLSSAQAWAQLNDAKIQGDTIFAKVVSVVKGGVLVDVADLKGFIPTSQLRGGAATDTLINTKIEVKVLEVDPKKNKLIFSQRQAVDEARGQMVDEIISNLEEGRIVKGEVVRIADFGAFVDINGIDGLLPISEMSWSRIKHPSDVITLGESLEVMVIKIDSELKRISLSLKRLGEDPWQKIEGEFKEGQTIEGTVNKVTSFGTFINIFPGVEALLPISEINGAGSEFKAGDSVKVVIKKFTPQEHRIALTMAE